MVGILHVILGPTGAGKSEYAMTLARKFGCGIISADSRQIYREIPIGTAAPTKEMMQEIKHWFVGTKSISEHYSAGQFEIDALLVIENEIKEHGHAVMCGGSMMYIDAICNGIDAIPDISDDIREHVSEMFRNEGLDAMKKRLKTLDPEYYGIVDLRNWKRVVHAVEICEQTGGTFTELRKGRKRERDFEIEKTGIYREREDLYERINRRVIEMMDQGLEQEARTVYPLKELNALNTVGYKEMFGYFEGQYDLDEAIRLVQRNTRHYARKQMTWFRRDNTIDWKTL
ncbi:MAG: tRNA (adenosine(37)-N6)-dimethylallyltransferase MiaA [Paludibacteraceae bacterium]|nr:tRNA (adenosine(37)-N6)-dimethylallyltransferase MiaA [Paludibacteraceae bacterium]